ncbi:trypsin-like serine protease [Streptomyces sp. bgisy154]|uniref:trypsin-like serine protease n=1 Tax=Streptomyces sp. bgisy154 TaxID=3413794 RepID=UPI003D732F16
MRRRTRAGHGALAVGLLAATGTLGAGHAEAVVGDPAADGVMPYTARIEIGDTDRACSGALIEARWVVTAASCFATDPAQPTTVAAGAPPLPTRAVVGRTGASGTPGQVRDVVELVPRADRDLVLARLSAPVRDIAPATLGAQAPAAGEELTVAGYGRTHDTWVPDRPHTGAFTVTGTRSGELDIDTQSGAVCQGDAGGPAVRTGTGELVAVNSRSWQGGCLGSDATARGAVETRLDDITDWIGAHVARWSLKSLVNGKYVAAELNATGTREGALRARSDTAEGSWEQFTLHTGDAGTTVSLRSVANGLYVSTENNETGAYEGMLRARTEVPHGWERYTLVPQGAQNYALKAASNGRYVAVEANYTGADAGLLRARSDSVATWERFTFQHADNFRVAGVAPAAPAPLPLG